MMRKFSLFIVVLLCSILPSQSHAIDYSWTKTFGFQSIPPNSYTSMHLKKVLIDGNNLYATGEYTFTVDFDPSSSVDSRTTNFFDIFLMKLKTDGTYVWTKTVGGAGFDKVSSLSVDSYSNVFIAGSHVGGVDFDPGAGVDNHPLAGAYVSKTNADGSYAWTKTFVGSAEVKKVLHSKTGVIFLVGNFTGTVDFDPSVAVDIRVNNSTYQKNIFITKLNTTGAYLGTTVIGAGGYVIAESAVLDSVGDMILSGTYFATVDFDPSITVDNHTAPADPAAFRTYGDAFVTKIKANGVYAWTKTFGDIQSELALKVITDTQNNIYLAGIYEGTVDFDPGIAVVNRTSISSAARGLFLLKLDAVGAYVWVQTTKGNFNNNGWVNDLNIDNLGNIFMLGYGAGESHDASVAWALGSGPFVSKFNNSGAFLWSRDWVVSNGINSLNAETTFIDGAGNAFVGGSFDGTVDMNPLVAFVDNKTPNHPQGGDAFIIKLSGFNNPDIKQVSVSWGGYNPSGGIPGVDTTGKYVFRSSDSGSIQYTGGCSSPVSQATLGDNTINFQNLAPGIYDKCFITVTNSKGVSSNVLKIPSFQVYDNSQTSGSSGGCLVAASPLGVMYFCMFIFALLLFPLFRKHRV